MQPDDQNTGTDKTASRFDKLDLVPLAAALLLALVCARVDAQAVDAPASSTPTSQAAPSR